jgi:mannose-6-phosphate isomerase-like protein (cupin superfamily)
MEMYDPGDFKTCLYFFRQGVLPPKTGIGEHIHDNMEVMYIILAGAARITLDGQTGELGEKSIVLCPVGSSHGIYNYTDREVVYLQIACAADEGPYSIVVKNNDLTNGKPIYPPPFRWAKLYSNLQDDYYEMHEGKGWISCYGYFRSDSFTTRWESAGQCFIPPGSSIGYHRHDTIEEIYYILSGSGRLTVDDETFDVRRGDCIPCFMHSSHGIYNNDSTELSFLVFQFSMTKNKLDSNDLGDDLADR